MARKKKPEEHENHERWLISYADFITLLFAFFVVMYSVSSVNEGKYRVVSRSLIAAFGTPVKSLAPIQIGELVRAQESKAKPKTLNSPSALPSREVVHLNEGNENKNEGNGNKNEGDRNEKEGVDEKNDELQKAAREIEKSLQQLVEDELVIIREMDGSLEVEIRSSVLFASGSGEVADSALSILKGIAEILGDLPNVVHVEGFTDNRPINTFLYPSNWELSAARSSRVVRHLVESGIDPLRLVSVGYGEYRPIASNETSEGRARNRRVVLVVKSDAIDADRLLTGHQDLDEVLAAASLNTEPPMGGNGQEDFSVDPGFLDFSEEFSELEQGDAVVDEQAIDGPSE